MDDIEFVRRCVKGDKRSWDAFVERYASLIYNYIHSTLKIKGHTFSQENINDLFQEIILSLFKDNFRKLSTFKGRNGCSLASWLRQVTVNFTIDHLRRLKPALSLNNDIGDNLSFADMLVSDSPPVTDTLNQEERLMHLKDCIERLGINDKYFLELHIYRGLSIEELRVFLKVSRAAADMRKSRIVERLKECFRKKGLILR
ncbi:MAG: RNA polymerase sigma factor [Candidatus Omnitrophota bacterium]|jgi:RNA polymerase sigma factor (sigma-70 family)